MSELPPCPWCGKQPVRVVSDFSSFERRLLLGCMGDQCDIESYVDCFESKESLGDPDWTPLEEKWSKRFPVDDSELADSKWLASVGGKVITVMHSIAYVISIGAVQVAVLPLSGAMQLWVSVQKNGQVQTSAASIITSGTTRGNVRNLCSSLGHDLGGLSNG